VTTTPDRPQPLQEIARDVAVTAGLWMGIATALVSAGLISVNTSSLITSLYGLIPGALAAFGTIMAARHVATAGSVLVTPVSDPRNDNGQRLVPETLPPVMPPPVAPGTTFPPISTTTAGGSTIFGPLGT